MRLFVSLSALPAVILLAISCGTRSSGGGGGGGAAASGVGGGGDTGGVGGARAAYCATVDPTASECPPGSAKRECSCLPGSMPCLGLDEAKCNALALTQQNPEGFCTPIYGSDGPETSPGHIYLGCMTADPGAGYDGLSCMHAPGSDDCKYSPTSAHPDGWVLCTQQSGACECAPHVTQADCTPGSRKECCCDQFPNSLPCEGLAYSPCFVRENDAGTGLCHVVLGRAWDPVTMQPMGPEIYLGCRSTCQAEQPHGDPTCTHDPTKTTCDLADDARIPDGWSTDCSACTPSP